MAVNPADLHDPYNMDKTAEGMHTYVAGDGDTRLVTPAAGFGGSSGLAQLRERQAAAASPTPLIESLLPAHPAPAPSPPIESLPPPSCHASGEPAGSLRAYPGSFLSLQARAA